MRNLPVVTISVKLLLLLAAAASASGCFATNPEGSELYLKIGGRAVDKHQESQSTETSCGGLMGWARGCSQTAKVEGS